MIAACAIHIPIPTIPARVEVIRGGRRVMPPATGKPGSGGLFLEQGDQVNVARRASFSFSFLGNRYTLRNGSVSLTCRRLLLDPLISRPDRTVLAVGLDSGHLGVRVLGKLPRHAVVVSRELMALATRSRTRFELDRDSAKGRTTARTLDRPIVAARSTHQELRVETQATYTAISDSHGLRLDVWPFSISRLQRAVTPSDALVPFWSDGRQCSVGCSAPGVTPGWPIKPFQGQHAIRSGLNELRPANFHIGIDIEARNFEPVYPIQSGSVRVIGSGTPDEHVQVGQFQYWHIDHKVSDGQYAVAYQTELGTVKYDFRHVHLSELGPSGQYLDPLRPGRTVSPYSDTAAPIIGTPQVFSDGRVIVDAFDPQSFVEKASYETPVLAPAALAWRLFDGGGHDLAGLNWALRGSQNYPPSLKPVIFAPGASNPGYDCFAYHHLCIPRWTYWLAGGLTQRLPLGSLSPGRYRLTVYAWDWSGNTSALDYWINLPLSHAANVLPAEPLHARFDP